jgi:hypothetical protein
MAEASGSRTHRRRRKTTTAGFEDRDDHRTACASLAGDLEASDPHPKIKQDPTLYKVWVDERVSPSRVLGTEPRLQAAEPNLL